jgi:predicted nucleotide-binding protein (sugar kinase/HSP70/actin superfamily)
MRTVAIPKLGDYTIPLDILIERTLDCATVDCPPITKHTVEIGAKNSPDTVCTPFKIIMGQFLEVIPRGANAFVMPAFGCRLGFYDILHKQILNDLGHDIEMITLFDYYATANKMFVSLSAHNPNLTRERFDTELNLVAKIIVDMDKIGDYMRRNAAFEVHKGAFNKLHKEYLREIRTLTNIADARELGAKYIKAFENIKIDKPHDPIRIGIIGDLYSVIEPHGNCNLVKYLIQNGVEVVSKVDMTYLANTLFDVRALIAKSAGYVNYSIGGNANNTIALGVEFARAGLDGVIHVKAATCTPEITAMTILQNISNDFNVPFMYLTFDTETGEAGLHTRLEAFLDMLEMKRRKGK